MKSIWKFELEETDSQVITMPKGAIVISADVQNGRICLWAAVETTAKTEERRFYIRGTGHEIKPQDKFIGTVQQGIFVWHIFQPAKA